MEEGFVKTSRGIQSRIQSKRPSGLKVLRYGWPSLAVMAEVLSSEEEQPEVLGFSHHNRQAHVFTLSTGRGSCRKASSIEEADRGSQGAQRGPGAKSLSLSGLLFVRLSLQTCEVYPVLRRWW